jgi:hypothetical protein
MAYSKARRLSDLISATGEVASYADASIVPADLHATLDLTGKTITVANTSTGDSDTTVANTAFVQQEIAALVASAPGTLNTLNELAAALGDDASFSTTVTDSIATKLPLAGGTMTGALAMNTNAITSTGNLTLDVAGDIILDADGDDWKFNNAGTTTMEIKHESTSVDFYLSATDDDFKFKGSDGGSTITALQLDMSEAGAATFNNSVDATNFKIAGAQGSDGQVLTSTGSGVAWEAAASSFDTLSDTTVSTSDPATNTNPSTGIGTLWLNKNTGNIWCCTGVTNNDNQWTNIGTGSVNYGTFPITGGTVTTAGGYTFHTFTSSGTLNAPDAKSGVAILIVAGGGGGGGRYYAGGGGAGGMLEYTGQTISGDHTVTIGAGGVGGGHQADGADGGDSSVSGLSLVTAVGGGGGGGHTGANGGDGRGNAGGSSGGASGYRQSGGLVNNVSAPTSGQGNYGDTGGTYAGGGGGGKGAAATGSGSQDGGDGGVGKAWLNSTYYAAGGGGGAYGGTKGDGGNGGGGAGSDSGADNAVDGTANTGGGGGGAQNYTGGLGGSGVVIFRYTT